MDEFVALRDLLHGAFYKAALGGACTPDGVLAALGVDTDTMLRAVPEFANVFGIPEPKLFPAVSAFAFAFALGHKAGIRRAAMAASVPAARGREDELFALLLKGFSIDAALARLAASSRGDGAEHAGSNVIALKPARSEAAV
jgi:hypothetical protein